MSNMGPLRVSRVAALVLGALAVLSVSTVEAQRSDRGKPEPEDVKSFREFTDRVQAYLVLRKKVEKSLPSLDMTSVPEKIAAYEAAFAAKLGEARARAKVGDVFTEDSREAFRRAGRKALGSPNRAAARAYMQAAAPDPAIVLRVNGVYPYSEPSTFMSPVLLAAFPALPEEVEYGVLGRTLFLLDAKARLIIDLARLTLPPLQ